MKVCSRCKSQKEESAFGKDKVRHDGLKPHCKECQSIWDSSYKEQKSIKNAERYAKNPEHFKKATANWKSKNWDRVLAGCRRWRENNPEKRKSIYAKSSRKRLYGLTEEQFQTMLSSQDGKCSICGRERSQLVKQLCVDHDHETGKVRGLLCDKCNRGLGFFNDDHELLKKALNYLTPLTQE